MRTRGRTRPTAGWRRGAGSRGSRENSSGSSSSGGDGQQLSGGSDGSSNVRDQECRRPSGAPVSAPRRWQQVSVKRDTRRTVVLSIHRMDHRSGVRNPTVLVDLSSSPSRESPSDRRVQIKTYDLWRSGRFYAVV